jgi:hypothetical protein
VLGAAIATAPALTYAQHAGGGGGGGHFGGGGGAHFGGGGAHFGGAAHFGGGRPAYGGFAGPTHFGGAVGFHGAGVSPHVAAGFAGGAHFAPGAVSHGFVGHPGAAYAPGNAYWHGGHGWYGGYWNGVFWPHVWFNPGFAWYLPILPLGYATFWWGGLPYYYYNNLYYTWNPGYNGYVVTDPPPAGGDTSADSNADMDNSYEAAPDSSQAAPAPAPGQPAPLAAPMGGGGGQVFLYPRNGQSDSQTQNDRYECHSWAVNQTGFDPTRPNGQSGNAADYRRAMIACLDARGYSAR